MSAPNRKIAIVGASGNVGREIVKSLLTKGQHSITAIARASSEAQFPSQVAVMKGDLNSSKFLGNALSGQDIVVLALAIGSDPDIPAAIIKAAAAAGVKYVLPPEFSTRDELRARMAAEAHAKKLEDRRLVEALGISKWIAIVNGTWFDYSLEYGNYQIDIARRQATIWTPTTTKVNVTTVAQVGRGVAALLSLPDAELAKYGNGHVYLSSFLITQSDILASVQRVTNTTDKDWDIKFEDVHQAVETAERKVREAFSMEDFIVTAYGKQFTPGSGADYGTSQTLANPALGLEAEDLDTATKKSVEKILGNQ